MTNTNLLQAMGRIDPKLIADAAPDVPQKKEKKPGWIKWGAMAACLCLILTAAIVTLPGILKGQVESGLYYEKGKYTIVGESCGDNRIIPSSFDELEARARYLINGEANKDGIIIQCSVDGASVNRIIEPSEEERDLTKIYGINHVLTPVKVEKIFYAGSNVDIEEGGVYFVKEPFFYVDESAEPYFSMYGPGTIYAKEYTPLQKGNQYILYLTLLDDEIYNYNNEPILSLIGLQEAAYCIASERTAKAVIEEESVNYWTLWEDVMQSYCAEQREQLVDEKK